MKVIDLLNKIANGEDIKKFKYYTIYTKDFEGFYRNENGVVFDEMIILEDLNDEIEIIEDTPKEDKKIKKLDTYVDIASFNNSVCYAEDESLDDWIASLQKGLEEQTKFNRDVLYKINEIIDKVNGDK